MKHRNIILVLLALLLALNFGCAVQQVREQGGTELQQAMAARLEAVQWFDTAQVQFTTYILEKYNSGPVTDDFKHWTMEANKVFNDAYAILQAWKDAETLAEMDNQSQKWGEAFSKLLALGINNLVEVKTNE